MTDRTSRIPALRTASQSERRRLVARASGLAEDALERALEGGGLDPQIAEQMVENALGTFGLPLGVALNFTIDGRDHLVPMAIEEPSVVAAASHAAKRVRQGGGFITECDPPILAGQVQLLDVADPGAAREAILAAQGELLAIAHRAAPGLVERGGGAFEIEPRSLGEGVFVVHVHVHVCDAMGANAVNGIAEALGPHVARLGGGRLGLCILSNYCDRRLTRVRAEVPFSALGDDGEDGVKVAAGIEDASRFAELDRYRAVTHNKGILNGVDAVVVATGNDWRAVEAAAHAHASVSGTYRPLATWRADTSRGALVGQLELPLALGVVGGALRAHRGARAALEILGVSTGDALCRVVAAAGLATNLAALRALSTEGIQRGHMRLHRRALSSETEEPAR